MDRPVSTPTEAPLLAGGALLEADCLAVQREDGYTAFSGDGGGRLESCSADRDGLLSTLAVFGREAS